MTDLWTILIPLAITTAVMPIELTLTILLLRSSDGRVKAAAWVAGMGLVRLVQFAIFGVVLDRAMDDGTPGPDPIEGAFLLVVGMVLLVSVGRKLTNQPDEDAPPPRWMTTLSGVSADRAFLMGAGLVGLSPKHWAFTFAAIGAIGEAQLEPVAAWIVFAVWIVGAMAPHIAALLAVVISPRRAEPMLVRAGDALERSSRTLMIVLGLVFGVWFVWKALVAFGLL
jgi:hypothetical protein